MAFEPSFTIAQDPLSPSTVVVTDSSTGSDSNITRRIVYISDSAGDYLVPTGTTTDYIEWAIADSTLSVNILTEDTAVYAEVKWLDINDTVLYSSSDYFCLAQFNKNFFTYLMQLQGDTPTIPADTNYDSNCALFWSRVQGAINVVINNSDISSSQNCLNKATEMRLNQQKYF